jgi:hypothetical protein
MAMAPIGHDLDNFPQKEMVSRRNDQCLSPDYCRSDRVQIDDATQQQLKVQRSRCRTRLGKARAAPLLVLTLKPPFPSRQSVQLMGPEALGATCCNAGEASLDRGMGFAQSCLRRLGVVSWHSPASTRSVSTPVLIGSLSAARIPFFPPAPMVIRHFAF